MAEITSNAAVGSTVEELVQKKGLTLVAFDSISLQRQRADYMSHNEGHIHPH